MLLNLYHNPFATDRKRLLNYNPNTSRLTLQQDRQVLLSLVELAHKNWIITPIIIREEDVRTQMAYWSVCYYTDFILINVFDNNSSVELETKEFIQFSPTTRYLNVKINPDGLGKEIKLQIVDERGQYHGASYTMRSIRLVDYTNTEFYTIIEKFKTLQPYKFSIFGVDYEHLTNPLTGNLIEI